MNPATIFPPLQLCRSHCCQVMLAPVLIINDLDSLDIEYTVFAILEQINLLPISQLIQILFLKYYFAL